MSHSITNVRIADVTIRFRGVSSIWLSCDIEEIRYPLHNRWNLDDQFVGAEIDTSTYSQFVLENKIN